MLLVDVVVDELWRGAARTADQARAAASRRRSWRWCRRAGWWRRSARSSCVSQPEVVVGGLGRRVCSGVKPEPDAPPRLSRVSTTRPRPSLIMTLQDAVGVALAAGRRRASSGRCSSAPAPDSSYGQLLCALDGRAGRGLAVLRHRAGVVVVGGGVGAVGIGGLASVRPFGVVRHRASCRPSASVLESGKPFSVQTSRLLMLPPASVVVVCRTSARLPQLSSPLLRRGERVGERVAGAADAAVRRRRAGGPGWVIMLQHAAVGVVVKAGRLRRRDARCPSSATDRRDDAGRRRRRGAGRQQPGGRARRPRCRRSCVGRRVLQVSLTSAASRSRRRRRGDTAVVLVEVVERRGRWAGRSARRRGRARTSRRCRPRSACRTACSRRAPAAARWCSSRVARLQRRRRRRSLRCRDSSSR